MLPPLGLLVHFDRFSTEVVSLHSRDKHSHPLFVPWKELRNARKFVERQELFEKKYMIGSKLGEQAAESAAFHQHVVGASRPFLLLDMIMHACMSIDQFSFFCPGTQKERAYFD